MESIKSIDISTRSCTWNLDNNQWHKSFSNFTRSPIVLECFSQIISAPTGEHAYQALKTDIPDEQKFILAQISPSGAKAQGRCCTLRGFWDSGLSTIAMISVVSSRYYQDKSFRELLDTTLPEYPIVEVTSWGDRIWGTDKKGYGQNRLGQILMKMRACNCWSSE